MLDPDDCRTLEGFYTEHYPPPKSEGGIKPVLRDATRDR
jgi:hypothetical protein